MPVDVVHWNPSRPVLNGRFGRRLPIRKRVNNFGDLLGPVIVNKLILREGLSESEKSRRLLAVGSILRLAANGDTIWGIGANGKSLGRAFDFSQLDVRAVRGPLTRGILAQIGINAPEVYGDPALLIPQLWTDSELGIHRLSRGTIHVPNMHDFTDSPSSIERVSPIGHPLDLIREIASSSFVVGSSLHAIIVAEAYGIPARFVKSATEPAFKYEDYWRGTGRDHYKIADDVEHAIKLGPADHLSWDPNPLISAFPKDLWEAEHR